MSSSSTGLPTPEGPGSVSGAPHLPSLFLAEPRYATSGEDGLQATQAHSVTCAGSANAQVAAWGGDLVVRGSYYAVPERRLCGLGA